MGGVQVCLQTFLVPAITQEKHSSGERGIKSQVLYKLQLWSLQRVLELTLHGWTSMQMWPISPRPERAKCNSKKCFVLVTMAMLICHLLMTNVWGQPSCIAHCHPNKRMPLTSVWTWILKQPTWAVYFPKGMSELFAVACAVRHWLTHHVGHTHLGLSAHGSSSELTF